MQIVQDYRRLHAIPELDSTLPKTLSYIKSSLAPLQCRVFSPAAGALCAFFSFGKQKTVAFRADTDALPITEETSLPWKSHHHGIMHACGHDGHTAILLELARRIDKEKIFARNILLIFQPAEETTGGADAICKSGILEQLGVDAIFALHLWPGLEKGQIFTKPGFLMSRCSGIDISFTGKGGHIAHCAPGCDALNACCNFYSRTHYLTNLHPFVLKFGKLNAGTAGNVLCRKADLCGSLRTFREDTENSIRNALLNLCRQTEKQTGCRGEIFFSDGYPAVKNNQKLLDSVQKICPVQILDRAYWTGEDFSFYQQKVPGVYFLLGIGDTPPLHSSNFTFDETILSAGADFFFQLCRQI